VIFFTKAFLNAVYYVYLCRFAIGDHLHYILIPAVHIGQNCPDVFYGRCYLARGIADMRGSSIGVDSSFFGCFRFLFVNWFVSAFSGYL